MEKKSIPLCIFLSVITCGIYGLFWFYRIANVTIKELGYESIDSPGLNLLFLIITFGIYGMWWNYKISTYLSQIEKKKNMEPDFWGPLMSLSFGKILHQSRINRLSQSK